MIEREVIIREPFNAISHYISAFAATVGTIFLFSRTYGNFRLTGAVIIYGLSLVALFLASAIYHTANRSPKTMLILRKLDHSAIYFLIAGSYTPICVYFFRGFWQWGMMAIIWSMAITGVLMKVFIINAPRWITAGVYLVMGWMAILAVSEIWLRMPIPAIIWLVIGGLFYSIGAIIYITKKLNFIPGIFGFHEIWHLFVIFGAASHFYLVARYIAYAS